MRDQITAWMLYRISSGLLKLIQQKCLENTKLTKAYARNFNDRGSLETVKKLTDNENLSERKDGNFNWNWKTLWRW